MMRALVMLPVLVWSVVAPAVATAAPLSLADASKAVRSDRNRLWKDPESIRDARISAPHACPYRPAGSVCVCIEANARNAMGGYTGLTKTRIYFEGRKIIDAVGPLGTAAPDQCGTFLPFPELNGRR